MAKRSKQPYALMEVLSRAIEKNTPNTWEGAQTAACALFNLLGWYALQDAEPEVAARAFGESILRVVRKNLALDEKQKVLH